MKYNPEIYRTSLQGAFPGACVVCDGLGMRYKRSEEQ